MVIAAVLSALALAGPRNKEADCQHPELEQRLAEVEARLGALEARASAAAEVPTADMEQAAADLLERATEAMDGLDYDAARTALARLDERYPQTRAMRASQRLRAQLAVVGKPEAPLGELRWLQGSPADLGSGKATLYVFWEVWCPYCKRELPKLARTYDRFRDRGLDMVGLTKITRSATEEQVLAFVHEERLGFPIAVEGGDLSTHYGISGIPAGAIASDGVVIWRGHPASLTDEMIDEILHD